MDKSHIDWKVGAFYPTGALFRQIYGACLVDYAVEMGKVFLKNYEVWANVDWMHATGHTRACHSRTRFENVNVSLGGKYVFRLYKCLNVYAGLGINAAFAHVHNDSRYVEESVHKNGTGGVAKFGLYFEPVNHLFIELFADYLYQRLHFQNHIQIGGIKAGGGIGLCF